MSDSQFNEVSIKKFKSSINIKLKSVKHFKMNFNNSVVKNITFDSSISYKAEKTKSIKCSFYNINHTITKHKSYIINKVERKTIYNFNIINKIENKIIVDCILYNSIKKTRYFKSNITILKYIKINLYGSTLMNKLSSTLKVKSTICMSVVKTKIFGFNITSLKINVKNIKCFLINSIKGEKSYAVSITNKLENNKNFKFNITNIISNKVLFPGMINILLHKDITFNCTLYTAVINKTLYSASINTIIHKSKSFKCNITNLIEVTNIFKNTINISVSKTKYISCSMVNAIDNKIKFAAILSTSLPKDKKFNSNINIREFTNTEKFKMNISNILTRSVFKPCIMVNKLESIILVKSTINITVLKETLFSSTMINKIEKINSVKSEIHLKKFDNMEKFNFNISNKLEKTSMFSLSYIVAVDDIFIIQSKIINKLEKIHYNKCTITIKTKDDNISKKCYIVNKLEKVKTYNSIINIALIKTNIFKNNTFTIKTIEKAKMCKCYIKILLLEDINKSKCSFISLAEKNNVYSSFIINKIQKNNIFNFNISTVLQGQNKFKCSIKIAIINKEKLFKLSFNNVLEGKMINKSFIEIVKGTNIFKRSAFFKNAVKYYGIFNCSIIVPFDTYMYCNLNMIGNYTKVYSASLTTRKDKSINFISDINIPLYERISIKKSFLKIKINQIKSFNSTLFINPSTTMYAKVSLIGGYTKHFKCNMTTKLSNTISRNFEFSIMYFEKYKKFNSFILNRLDKCVAFNCNFYIQPTNTLHGIVTTTESEISNYFGKLIKDTYTNPNDIAANYGKENTIIMNKNNTIFAEWEFPYNQDKKYEAIGEFDTLFRIYINRAVQVKTTISLYEIPTTWKENDISEFNKPDLSDTPIHQFDLPINYVGPVDISLGEYLKSIDKTNSGFNISFAIKSSNDRDIIINSKEYTDNVLGLYYKYYIKSPNLRERNFKAFLEVGVSYLKQCGCTINIPKFDSKPKVNKCKIEIPLLNGIKYFKASINLPTVSKFNCDINIPTFEGDNKFNCSLIIKATSFKPANIIIPTFDGSLDINADIITRIDKIFNNKSNLTVKLFKDFKFVNSTIYIPFRKFSVFRCEYTVPKFDEQKTFNCNITIPIFERTKKFYCFMSSTHIFKVFKSYITIPIKRDSKSFKASITIKTYKRIKFSESKNSNITILDMKFKLCTLTLNISKFDKEKSFSCTLTMVKVIRLKKATIIVKKFIPEPYKINCLIVTALVKQPKFKASIFIPITLGELSRSAIITPILERLKNGYSNIIIPTVELTDKLPSTIVTRLDKVKKGRCIMYIGDGKRKVHIFWL